MSHYRPCSWCDSTGITEKGFCAMCRGRGRVEVLGEQPHQKSATCGCEEKMYRLLQIVASHTNTEQFARIFSAYTKETS